jgi:hypothetical protein
MATLEAHDASAMPTDDRLVGPHGTTGTGEAMPSLNPTVLMIGSSIAGPACALVIKKASMAGAVYAADLRDASARNNLRMHVLGVPRLLWATGGKE